MTLAYRFGGGGGESGSQQVLAATGPTGTRGASTATASAGQHVLIDPVSTVTGVDVSWTASVDTYATGYEVRNGATVLGTSTPGSAASSTDSTPGTAHGPTRSPPSPGRGAPSAPPPPK